MTILFDNNGTDQMARSYHTSQKRERYHLAGIGKFTKAVRAWSSLQAVTKRQCDIFTSFINTMCSAYTTNTVASSKIYSYSRRVKNYISQ